MSSYDASKIEEYQMILMKNPRSKVFAALAETYRKMEMHEEALETAQKGIQHNPEYPSGLVALARVLVDLEKFAEATPYLNAALSLRPENFLALRMLALCQIKLGALNDALKTYKNLLFQNPNDSAALAFVQKWEFLESVNFDFDHPLIPPAEIDSWVQQIPDVQQLLTIVDVFIHKNDGPSASRLIQSGQERWPQDPQLAKRLSIAGPLGEEQSQTSVKKAFWQNCLQRIEQRKNIDPLSF